MTPSEPIVAAGSEMAEDAKEEAEKAGEAAEQAEEATHEAASETREDLHHNEVMAELRSLHGKIDSHLAGHAVEHQELLHEVEQVEEKAEPAVPAMVEPEEEAADETAKEVEEIKPEPVRHSEPRPPKSSRRHFHLGKR